MLICSTKKFLMQHHVTVKHCVKELCNAAELHVDVESSPFGKRDNNGKKDQRRPDLIIHNLTRRGSSLAIDISIANPFSQVGGSNPRPLAAALSRETDKINKYATGCSKLKPCFPSNNPRCLWWDSTQHSAVCSQFSHQQGQELCTTKLGCTHTAKALLVQRLSVTLWTFNPYKVKPQSGIY